jgi:transcriptional regulator GlxA family with amidase domain
LNPKWLRNALMRGQMTFCDFAPAWVVSTADSNCSKKSCSKKSLTMFIVFDKQHLTLRMKQAAAYGLESKVFMNGSLEDIQDWLELAEQAYWCVSLLAMHCGVSVRTLELHFHAAKGECPRQWLFEQRMRRAKELLLAGSSVTETALTLGYQYDNVTHFSRDYKKCWGHPPSVERKKFLRKDKSLHSSAHSAVKTGEISHFGQK